MQYCEMNLFSRTFGIWAAQANPLSCGDDLSLSEATY
jgi:hypothetical protein